VDLHHIRDLLAQAVVLVVILFCFTLRVAQVSGVSMEPTVPANSYVLVSTLDFRLLPPRIGDVIAFVHDRVEPETFIKRVIATPGERVAEVNGTMFVNGAAVLENGRRFFDRRTTPESVVPEQRYYAVGDNRPKSDDSRNWGAVRRSSVIGRVDAVIWPFAQMRVVR
jgi:signal peptidase I